MEQRSLASFLRHREQPVLTKGGKVVKLCTYNVNSIRARKDLILRWLVERNNDLDVLCLQELKVTDRVFPHRDLTRLGFSCEVFGQKGFNGVAVCSKIPFENTGKGFGDKQWDRESRIMCVMIKGIHVVNVYVPHGDLRGTDKYNHKLVWYDRLSRFLKENFSPEDELVVVGDFNVARSDLDVFDGEHAGDGIGTMAEERQAFQQLLDWGLIDSFRALYPERKQYTWWDYVGGAVWKDEGMRIDYILCSEPLHRNVLDIEIDLWPRKRREPKPSDHAPVIVTVKLRNEQSA